MTADVVVQGGGWAAAVWLLVDQTRRNRAKGPDTGRRPAGGVAAVSVVVLAGLAGLWPVAAIGLLWLRTTAFPHAVTHLPATHLPHPHLPHLDARRERLIWRVELTVVAVVVAVMLSGWVAEQLDLFDRRADATLCRLLEDGC